MSVPIMPSASPDPQSPGEDYFNDLSQQNPTSVSRQNSTGQHRGSMEEGLNGQIPKPKRIACILCRKRKLRCDGNKPSCGTCLRLQHDCSYDEVRRKSGPKRGYVKALEARLLQVETLLKTQEEQPTAQQGSEGGGTVTGSLQGIATGIPGESVAANVDRMQHIDATAGPVHTQYPAALHPGTTTEDTVLPGADNFPWEMIGLGIDEPLPAPEVVLELTNIYFDKIHPSVPMIHRPRYFAAMNLAPQFRPPVCLRYAMWAMAASVSDKYEQLQEHFYMRARKYIQQDEMKGHGETMITVAHCQAWVLLASYEFKLMYFPRAWMSSGRACRMGLMMGLHRLDGRGLDVKQCLAPAKDWTEREERRRTFWMCFCVDRYSSIGTGWPMTIEESDIMTTLPCEDEDYELNRQTTTLTMEEAFTLHGAPKLSSFAGVTLMACLFGRNLVHLHRPSPDDHDDDLDGEFWRRHRSMDNTLLNTALALPDQLRLPLALNEPNVVFMNMNLHTSTICLHQAAIFKADKNKMPPHISAESKVRCITAAAEIASIMRQISHLDLSAMNPFISFCLYVAARVFIQYLKSRPKDSQRKASLQFLLSAMHAVKRRNPLTESFLVQLDVDLESAGLEDSRTLRGTLGRSTSVNYHDAHGNCSGVLKEPSFQEAGTSIYNNPSQNENIARCASIPNPPDAPDATTLNSSEMSAEAMGFIPNACRFDLPHRTPGSHPSSNVQEMDISPDGTGGATGETPASSTQSQHAQSSHTSNTAYTPPNVHQTQQLHSMNSLHSQADSGAMSGIINTHSADTFNGFNMQDFTNAANATQQGFPLPNNWTAPGTGLTPGPTGLTPGQTGLTPGPSSYTPGGGMHDMMGMTDADWSQVLEIENFGNEWDTGIDHHGNLIHAMQRRM